MKQRILIIDDDDDVLLLMRLMCEDAGLKAEVAIDGRAGISKALSFQPDLILLDILMPGMNGWEVCRQLRSLPQTQSIPVIILTGIQSEEVDRRARDMGADRVVIKSIDNEGLMQAVREILAS